MQRDMTFGILRKVCSYSDTPRLCIEGDNRILL